MVMSLGLGRSWGLEIVDMGRELGGDRGLKLESSLWYLSLKGHGDMMLGNVSQTENYIQISQSCILHAIKATGQNLNISRYGEQGSFG